MVQRVANRYDPAEIDCTLVCIHVANPPAYQTEERYLPIFDQFVAQCDMGLDFHAST